MKTVSWVWICKSHFDADEGTLLILFLIRENIKRQKTVSLVAWVSKDSVSCFFWNVDWGELLYLEFLFSFFMQLKFYPPTFLPYISSSPRAPHGELQLMDEFRADFVPCSRGRNVTQACFPRETQALDQSTACRDQHSLEPGRQPLSLRQH